MSNTNLPLLDTTGKAVGKVDVPAAFSREPKVAVLHFAVTRHLANRRAGTADTKRRDDVRGGGKKPWRQKGTGRARAGSIRSPLWRKGGVVFGPHPRSYNIAMNRRARRAALGMAVAAKAADGSISIVDAAGFKPAKTKEFVAFLEQSNSSDRKGKVLFIVDREKDEHARAIALAGANLRGLTIAPVAGVSAHALLAHDRVIFTKNAYESLAEVCSA
ncbi:MAG TPA: 50S ribosomal protein L4 [Candidatus Eremiobacteraceae bacterium]|nr:50S ribosomal protein L4 [Candidatus Eremiobacteraceae bacterium]